MKASGVRGRMCDGEGDGVDHISRAPLSIEKLVVASLGGRREETKILARREGERSEARGGKDE